MAKAKSFLVHSWFILGFPSPGVFPLAWRSVSQQSGVPYRLARAFETPRAHCTRFVGKTGSLLGETVKPLLVKKHGAILGPSFALNPSDMSIHCTC